MVVPRLDTGENALWTSAALAVSSPWPSVGVHVWLLWVYAPTLWTLRLVRDTLLLRTTYSRERFFRSDDAIIRILPPFNASKKLARIKCLDGWFGSFRRCCFQNGYSTVLRALAMLNNVAVSSRNMSIVKRLTMYLYVFICLCAYSYSQEVDYLTAEVLEINFVRKLICRMLGRWKADFSTN